MRQIQLRATSPDGIFQIIDTHFQDRRCCVTVREMVGDKCLAMLRETMIAKMRKLARRALPEGVKYGRASIVREFIAEGNTEAVTFEMYRV